MRVAASGPTVLVVLAVLVAVAAVALEVVVEPDAVDDRAEAEAEEVGESPPPPPHASRVAAAVATLAASQVRVVRRSDEPAVVEGAGEDTSEDALGSDGVVAWVFVMGLLAQKGCADKMYKFAQKLSTQ